MSNNMNSIWIALLIIAAAFFAHGAATICFIRSGSTGTSNGTATSCTGFPYCYSYMSDSYHYAGCSMTSYSCSSYSACVSCSTDYCNSVTPSSISCFARNGGGGGNGTQVTCPTGITTCYSSMEGSYQYAGCSITNYSCSSSLACVTCSTDYCNSVTPSSISCFARSYIDIGNGTQVTCNTGISTCYSSMEGSYSYGRCGRCPLNTACITCNTSYCNTRTPSSISCHYRYEMSLSTFTSNGIAISCPTGFSTCYSYTNEWYSFGGCSGTINNVLNLTCSTDNCNTHFPSSISCFGRDRGYHAYSGSTSNSNGTMTPCSTGVATCFSYLVPLGYQYFDSHSGCGVCNATASALYGCTTCNTSSCNYITVSAQATSAPTSSMNSPQPLSSYVATTAAPNAASNQPGTVASTAAAPNAASNQPGTVTSTTARTSGQTSSVNCFYSFAETTYIGRRKVTCDSGGSCYEYSFKVGFTDYFFAGCGNCTASSIYSIFGCRACGTDYCNSAAVTAGNCAVAAVVAGFVALALM